MPPAHLLLVISHISVTLVKSDSLFCADEEQISQWWDSTLWLKGQWAIPKRKTKKTSAVGNYACFKNTYAFHRDPELCEGLNILKNYISQSNLIYFIKEMLMPFWFLWRLNSTQWKEICSKGRLDRMYLSRDDFSRSQQRWSPTTCTVVSSKRWEAATSSGNNGKLQLRAKMCGRKMQQDQLCRDALD